MPSVFDFVKKERSRDVVRPLTKGPQIESGGIVDMLTGANQPQSENLPELAETFPPTELTSLPAKLAFSTGDIGKLGILKQVVGEVASEIDPHGNIIVDLDDSQAKTINVDPGRYFLNRPGFSRQDVNDIIVTGAFQLFPATKGAALGKRFLGPVIGKIGRALGVGLGTGTGSVLQDVSASSLGSNQGIDIQKALAASLIGAGAETAFIGMEQLTAFLPGFLRSRRFVRGNTLTPEGRATLENIGIDPDKMTPQFIEKFRQAMGESTNPAEAAVVADAASLPQPVRLSRGDVTRDVTQQGLEDAALKGQLGEVAKKSAKDFHDAKQGDLLENIRLIRERIAKGRQVDKPGQGIQMLRERIRKEQIDLEGQVNTAYTIARESGSASMAPEIVDEFSQHLRFRLADKFLESEGAVPKILDALEDISQKARSSSARVEAAELEKWSQRLNARGRVVKGTPESAAISIMQREFASFRDGAIDRALFSGDLKVLEKFKKARGLRRQLRNKFESNDIVQKLIEVSDESGEMALRYTPEDSLNFIFGANDIGSAKGAASAVRKIKRLVGEDSPEWLAFKEEAVLRLFRRILETGPRSARNVNEIVLSGNNFARSFDTAMRKAPEVMREIFSKADLALLEKFKRVALQATNRVSGAINPSGTAGRIALLAQTMARQGMIGNIGTSIIRGFFEKAINAESVMKVESATRPLRRIPSEIAPGIPAGLIVTGDIKRRSKQKARNPRGPQALDGLILGGR